MVKFLKNTSRCSFSVKLLTQEPANFQKNDIEIFLKDFKLNFQMIHFKGYIYTFTPLHSSVVAWPTVFNFNFLHNNKTILSIRCPAEIATIRDTRSVIVSWFKRKDWQTRFQKFPSYELWWVDGRLFLQKQSPQVF